MTIGQFIRRLFGPLEKTVSAGYRAIFINLNDLVCQIKRWASASNILDIGCGEGIFTEYLIREYPHTNIFGIDISHTIGRMLKRNPHRVVLKQDTIEKFAAKHPSEFDLITIVDVMHHVLVVKHKYFLIQAKKALKPNGYLVLKEWERSPNFINALAYFMDRFIGGAIVNYLSAKELRELVNTVFGQGAIKGEARIKPHKNNIVFLIQNLS